MEVTKTITLHDNRGKRWTLERVQDGENPDQVKINMYSIRTGTLNLWELRDAIEELAGATE